MRRASVGRSANDRYQSTVSSTVTGRVLTAQADLMQNLLGQILTDLREELRIDFADEAAAVSRGAQ